MIRKTKDFFDYKYSVLDDVLNEDKKKMTKTAGFNEEANGIQISKGMQGAMEAGTGMEPHGFVQSYGPVVKPIRSEDMYDMIKQNLDAIDVPQFDGLGKGMDSDKGFESLEDALKKDENVLSDEDGDSGDLKAILESLKAKVESAGESAKGGEKKEMSALIDLIDAEIDESEEGNIDEDSVKEAELLAQWLMPEAQEELSKQK